MEFESIMNYEAHNWITDIKEISQQYTESNRIEYSVNFDNRVRSYNKVYNKDTIHIFSFL